jgi:asparagine synthase (glutamine-hydrolysing)
MSLASALVVRWGPESVPQLVTASHLAGRDVLARELGLPCTSADQALIAAAWHRWGVRGLSRLAGPFALAALDPAGRLVLARDQLGQLPVFYARIPGGVVTSVDLGAVLAHPDVGTEIDPEAVACLQAQARRPMLRRTGFARVAKVPPGHLVELTGSTTREQRYWHPAEVPAGHRRSPAEWAEGVRDVLTRAVGDALPADASVAAHVSGGLDSTAVAVLAQRELRRRGRELVAAYSWSPPPDHGQLATDQDARRISDERWLVALTAAAESWPVSYVPREVPPSAPPGGPIPTTQLLRHWDREAWVRRDAAARGVDVLLSGWGGDEGISFGGRNLVPWLASRGRLLAAHRELRRREAVTGSPRPRAAVALLAPLLPGPAVRAARRVSGRPDPATRRRQAWHGHRAFVRDALQEQQSRLARAASGSPHDLQVALLEDGYLAQRCEAWSGAAAALGLSYRYPLLDLRVVEFALCAPAACFRSDGQTRPAFRQAVAPFLPAPVVGAPVKSDPVLRSLAREGRPQARPG